MSGQIFVPVPQEWMASGRHQRQMTPEEKRREARRCCLDEDVAVGGLDSPKPYEEDLVLELARAYHWYGGIWADYIFFVRNWHPLLGILVCHPLHPWGKLERLLATLVSCATTLLASAAIASMFGINGSVLLFWLTLFASTFESSMYMLAVGKAYCPGCFCLTCLADGVKGFCFAGGMVCLMALAFLDLLVIQDESDVADLFWPLLHARLKALLMWFPINLLVPCIGFLPVWLCEKPDASVGMQGLRAGPY